MSVYIGYCFYLCGETAQAAGDVAERASETARLFGLERHIGTADVGVVKPLREPCLRLLEIITRQRGFVDDAVKFIEGVCDRAGTVTHKLPACLLAL